MISQWGDYITRQRIELRKNKINTILPCPLKYIFYFTEDKVLYYFMEKGLRFTFHGSVIRPSVHPKRTLLIDRFWWESVLFIRRLRLVNILLTLSDVVCF